MQEDPSLVCPTSYLLDGQDLCTYLMLIEDWMLVFAACGLSVRLFEGIDETRPPVSYSCVVGVVEPSQLLVDLAFVPRAGSDSASKARANRIDIRCGPRISTRRWKVDLVHASSSPKDRSNLHGTIMAACTASRSMH